jgi:hypothetical protein
LQLGDIGRDPPRLIFGEQFSCRAYAGCTQGAASTPFLVKE